MVKVGDKFRVTIADGRPEFQVTEIEGDIITAVGVPDWIEVRGRQIDANEWSGNGKRFLIEDVEREIQGQKRIDALFNNSARR